MPFEFLKPELNWKSYCGNQPTFGRFSTDFDYPTKGITSDVDYPVDACQPWLHYNMRLGNLIVEKGQGIGGSLNIGLNLITHGTGRFGGVVTAPTFLGDISGCSGKKSFDIPHATQPGKRIRHVCAEGPEAGIYVRGRLTGKNVIDLPDYWNGLVDPETITVTLTQIGTSQDLIVDRIDWGQKVYIKSGSAVAIDCYYVIQAARIDGEPLIVEYEGDTPAEYPGDDKQFSISGYDYDARGDKSTKEMSDD